MTGPRSSSPRNGRGSAAGAPGPRYAVRAAAVLVAVAAMAAPLGAQQRPGRTGALTTREVDALIARVQELDGRVLVGFKRAEAVRGVSPQGVWLIGPDAVRLLAAGLRGRGADIRREYRLIPAVAARVDTAGIRGLLGDPTVDYVEPDHPHEPHALRPEPAPPSAPQVSPWGIIRIGHAAAWSITRGSGVAIGIIDTGIDEDHPDLAVLGGINVVTGGTTRADWDDNSPSCITHGTHVAGTAAALDNAVDVVGVAPEAELYALRVFDPANAGLIDCLAWESDIIAAMEWAVTNQLDVINMSLGSSVPSLAEADAVAATDAAGVVVVAAAGNTGAAVGFPAGFPQAIAVSATDSLDNLAAFSSRGTEIDVAAPGVAVLSTYGGGTTAVLQGTSMAAPHVAGVAALIRAANPGLGPSEVRGILRSAAEDILDDGFDVNSGYGLLRADLAVAAVAGSVASLVIDPSAVTLGVPGGGAPRDATITLKSVGVAGQIDWTAASDQAWLTMSATNGTLSESAPANLVLTADPSGLTDGPHVALVTVGGGAANAPLALRVVLNVTGGLPIDAAAVTSGSVPTGLRRRFALTAAAGQKVDLLVQGDPFDVTAVSPQASPGLTWPVVRLYKPDGATPLSVDPNPFRRPWAMLPGVDVPEDGTYVVEVGEYQDRYPGAFIVKARPAAALLGVALSPSHQRTTYVPVQAHGASFQITDRLFDYAAFGTVDFVVTTSPPWLTASPASGTLTYPEIVDVTLTIDPTGLEATGIPVVDSVIYSEPGLDWFASGTEYAGDPGYLNLHVFSPGMDTLASGEPHAAGLTTDRRNRAVALTRRYTNTGLVFEGSLFPIDADGTVGPPIASGFGQGCASDVATGLDGSWYVGASCTGAVTRITASGEYTTFATFGDSPDRIAAGPTGQFYVSVCRQNRIYELSADGTATTAFGPTVSCPRGLLYSPRNTVVFAAQLFPGGLRVIGLDGSDRGVVAANVPTPRALAEGLSGLIYIGDAFGVIWTFDPADPGSGARRWAVAPARGEILGLDLVDGALLVGVAQYGMGWNRNGTFYRFPVADGPVLGATVLRTMEERLIAPGESIRVAVQLAVHRAVAAAAGYDVMVIWTPGAVGFEGLVEGSFSAGGTFSPDVTQASTGVLRVVGAAPAGVLGFSGLFEVDFTVLPTTPRGNPIDVAVSFAQLEGPTGEDLLPDLYVVPMQVCVSRDFGDVSGDGTVSAGDAVEILRGLVGLPLAEGTDLSAGDTNGDGSAGIADVTQILRSLVDLPIPPSSRLGRALAGPCS